MAVGQPGPALESPLLPVHETLACHSRERSARLFAYTFCLTGGPFLFVDGLLGLIFAPTSMRTGDHLPHREWNWFFEFNSWHQLTHVVSGLVLIISALRRSWLPLGLLAFGVFYAIEAPIGFINGDDVLHVVYSNARDNVIHTLFALLALTLSAAVVLFRGHPDRAR